MIMDAENKTEEVIKGALLLGAIGAGLIWGLTGSIGVGLIVGITLIVLTIIGHFKQQNNTSKSTTDSVYRPDGTGAQTLGETEYFCKIAGAHHRNKDEGAFIGVVTNDPDNEYDKNAIAIYRNDGKLMGYIPREEQRDFRKWSDRDPLPCVGYVRYGDYVDMYGSVKVIDADKRLTELHIMKFVRWLIENYGVDFIPNDFTVDSATPPQTEEEWLDYLDEYIAQY
jgi:hypothetical protein